MGLTPVALFLAVVVASLACQCVIQADDMDMLDKALPRNFNLSLIIPVFDFDGDSCYPSAAIGRKGQLNEGLNPSGRAGACRNDCFLSQSNTYHRYACVVKKMTEYCGHSFALYMRKDQSVSELWGLIGGSHRHDWASVIIWTVDGKWVYASCPGKTFADDEIPTHFGRPMFVYHKVWGGHHTFRSAKPNEEAENRFGHFLTPEIVSWFTMKGDGVSNKQLRDSLNKAKYSQLTPFPYKDSLFLEKLNAWKPKLFPEFTQESIDNSQ